jgi:hypothetical protein
MKTVKLVAVAVLAVVTFACGPKPEPVNASTPLAGTEYPEWVMKGSGAGKAGDARVFLGVGMAGGIKNAGLAQTTADNRARAELSKVFEVYSASLMKDYMASTTAGDMTASSEEQHVEQAIKTFSANTLSGVQITDHWYAPDGTVYSLATLDLEAFNDAMSKSNELSPAVRDRVRKNAEKVHMDLEAEEAKRAATEAP